MLNTISGIYCIICTTNGKYYVGSSDNIIRRKNCHFNDLKNKKHDNCHLQSAYDLYKKNSFKFLLIEEFYGSEKELLELEQSYLNIAKNQKDKCFNICYIAGKPPTMMGKKNPMFGKKFSLEHRKKLSQSNPKYWLGKKIPKKIIQKRVNSKKIQIKQLDLNGNLIKIWDSAKSASIFLNMKSCSSINNVLKKMNETAYGFRWEYK